MASHLLLAPGLPPRPSTDTLPGRALERAADRRHCLLEHLALLHEALAEDGTTEVRLEVGEAALRIADATAPAPPAGG